MHGHLRQRFASCIRFTRNNAQIGSCGSVGAMEIDNQIAAWHQRHADRCKPSPLLRDIANKGGKLCEIVSNVKL